MHSQKSPATGKMATQVPLLASRACHTEGSDTTQELDPKIHYVYIYIYMVFKPQFLHDQVSGPSGLAQVLTTALSAMYFGLQLQLVCTSGGFALLRFSKEYTLPKSP